MSEEKTKTDKVWDFFLKLTVPVSFVIGSYMIAHEVRLTRIEANRFTASDGAKMVVELRDYVTQNSPPAWLREVLTEIKASLREIDNRMRKLETK